MAHPSTRPQVLAINFPAWHRYDHGEAWKGEGWCEYELVRAAPPRFPGHLQPLAPQCGCYDESDPQWQAREIDLAADHGIDVMLFDWYWYSGVRLMEETLERGFLKAPNCNRLKFALMWANHDWADYFPAPFGKPWNMWLPSRHSEADTVRVIDYCIEHYFREPNYWSIDGRPYVSVFRPSAMIQQLGGPAACRQVLAQADRRMARAGLPPVHWAANCRSGDQVALVREAGFHSTFNYNITKTGRVASDYTESYLDLMDRHRQHWKEMSATVLPNAPIITMGWDVTPRCEHNIPWPFPEAPMPAGPLSTDLAPPGARSRYPYGPVVVGNTPERFRELCRLARRHLADHPSAVNAVVINAWNEWTESSYLLPETRTGLAYLDAVKAELG